jgi:hypothetical protein
MLVLAIGLAAGACVPEDPGPSAPTPTENHLWAECSLPNVADIHYASLAGAAEGDRITVCAQTYWRWTDERCLEPGIAIDPDACKPPKPCDTLRHETQHVHQFRAACDLCAADPAGRAFADCLDCYADYCDPETEAVAYHEDCQALRASGILFTEQGRGCDAERSQCKKVTAANRPLPASCRGMRPSCERIIRTEYLQCGG